MLFKVFTAFLLLYTSGITVKASPAPAPLSDLEALTGRATPLAQVITKCTVPNTVALTFDDGPEEYIYVCISSYLFLVDLWLNGKQNISRHLIAAGGKGTFCWNGDNCEYNSDRIKLSFFE